MPPPTSVRGQGTTAAGAGVSRRERSLVRRVGLEPTRSELPQISLRPITYQAQRQSGVSAIPPPPRNRMLTL